VCASLVSIRRAAFRPCTTLFRVALFFPLGNSLSPLLDFQVCLAAPRGSIQLRPNVVGWFVQDCYKFVTALSQLMEEVEYHFGNAVEKQMVRPPIRSFRTCRGRLGRPPSHRIALHISALCVGQRFRRNIFGPTSPWAMLCVVICLVTCSTEIPAGSRRVGWPDRRVRDERRQLCDRKAGDLQGRPHRCLPLLAAQPFPRTHRDYPRRRDSACAPSWALRHGMRRLSSLITARSCYRFVTSSRSVRAVAHPLSTLVLRRTLTCYVGSTSALCERCLCLRQMIYTKFLQGGEVRPLLAPSPLLSSPRPQQRLYCWCLAPRQEDRVAWHEHVHRIDQSFSVTPTH
jgi:hypothetical protein